jgi:hypothetical protein
MAKRERNDEKTEDPFSLPYSRGLHSYWAAKNSWSLDGLPGVQAIADMVKDDQVDDVLGASGLTRDAIFQGNKRKGMTVFSSGMIVGVMIGFSLAGLLRLATSRSLFANLGSAAHQLLQS